MPLQMPPLSPSQSAPQLPEPEYPAPMRETSGAISGIPTAVSHTSFSDKILVTISQEGRLSQWIHVPLSSPSPTDSFTADTITGASNSQDSLLPLPHLTPKTLLGGSNTARETVGQLYATQIASAILTRNPEEGRSLLVGLGLGKECFKMDGNGDGDGRREGFYDMVELVMKVI